MFGSCRFLSLECPGFGGECNVFWPEGVRFVGEGDGFVGEGNECVLEKIVFLLEVVEFTLVNIVFRHECVVFREVVSVFKSVLPFATVRREITFHVLRFCAIKRVSAFQSSPVRLISQRHVFRQRSVKAFECAGM